MKEYKEEKKTWEDTLVTEVVHGDEHEHGAGMNRILEFS